MLTEVYEEEALVVSSQRGDRNAFARLYEANVERVYRYLLARMREPTDAEDVTAEVFIRAMRALPSYKSRGIPFIAWLFRIARNQAINHLKKRTNRKEMPLMDSFTAPEDTEGEALKRVGFGEVTLAMNELTALQREVLEIRFGGGLSIAEASTTMDRTQGAVKFLQF